MENLPSKYTAWAESQITTGCGRWGWRIAYEKHSFVLGYLRQKIEVAAGGLAVLGVEQHREIVEMSREILWGWRIRRAMRFCVQRGGLLPKGAPRRKHPHSGIRILKKCRVILSGVGLDDLFLGRPRIAACPEFQFVSGLRRSSV